jgi:hypothetical protein
MGSVRKLEQYAATIQHSLSDGGDHVFHYPIVRGRDRGAIISITDSTTNARAATIKGGGTNHVLAYCDGSNLKVTGK